MSSDGVSGIAAAARPGRPVQTPPADPTGFVPAAAGAFAADSGEPLRTRASWRRASSTAMKLAELTLAQGAVFAFPLVFAVLCARTLGPAQYGVISFYTALTSFLCLFVEFGFDSIGVREVHTGTQRAHPEQVLWNVALARLMVCLPTCVLTVSVLLATRSSEASLCYAMALYLIAFAVEPSWYLRSLELMRPVLIVAAVSRLAGICVLFIVVSAPDDLPMAMWTYTFVAWASTVVGWLVLGRLHLLGKPRFDPQHLRGLFKSGAAIVLGNLGGASLTNGGIVVLGVIADPVVTGTANMALRARSVALLALVPFMQLGFVRLSALFGKDRRAAIALGRRLFYLLMMSSVLVSLLMIAYADELAALAYGLPEPPQAAGLMVCLLAASLPVNVAGYLFGLQSLTLFEKERAYVLIYLMAAALFFWLLLYFQPHTSVHYGAALLAAETWVVIATGLHLRRAVRAI